jgi:hypothetical protein
MAKLIPQPQRRVSFPEEEGAISTIVCELPSIDDFTEEDLERLWFSKADYHMSRAAAKVVSRESARFGFSKNLDDTYTEKNPDALERLQLWAVHGDSRRGLERWANKDHGELRQQDQYDVVMVILEAQDDMLSKSKDRKVDPEKLRKVSHKATKTARHFARMIGKADSYAMASELDKTNMANGDSETVATANTTRSGQTSVNPASPSKVCDEVYADDDDASTPSIIDGLKDSHHAGRTTIRFRRFGFKGKGMSMRKVSKEEERVPRVA